MEQHEILKEQYIADIISLDKHYFASVKVREERYWAARKSIDEQYDADIDILDKQHSTDMRLRKERYDAAIKSLNEGE